MEFQQKQAIYLQIADYICGQVLQDILQPGSRLLSIRELAAELEVNPNTVMRTYSYLEAQEIISKQRGIGYFVTEDGKGNTLNLKRELFLQQELPFFFRTFKLLGLSFDELINLYKEWEKS